MIYSHLSDLFGARIQPVKSVCVNSEQHSETGSSAHASTCCHDQGSDVSSKIEQRFIEKKMEKLQKSEFKEAHPNSKKCKKFRNRISDAEIKTTRLDPSYIANLTCSPTLPMYDSGAEPCCTAHCPLSCQEHFRNNLTALTEELELWWGKTSSKAFRANNLHHDILIGYNKAEEKQHWFIRDKEVCKNFYVRARGIARTTVEKSQREIISEQRSFCLL